MPALSVSDAYAALVAAGELKPDADQERAATALDAFADTLGRTRTGFLSRLFGRETPAQAGVYLWGGVGRGKSMLMDLAYANIDVEPKRREQHGRAPPRRAGPGCQRGVFRAADTPSALQRHPHGTAL